MAKHKKLLAPFGWVGGKRRLRDEIISIMPPHSVYVEVFGGSLNVLWAKPKIQHEIVNDINGDLINLFKVIRTRPTSLSIYLKKMLISREIFEDIRDKKMIPKNDIERGAFYYYLLSNSFGSMMSHFAMQKGTRRPKDIYKSFETWSKRLKFTSIESMNFERLIKSYDKEEVLFYCDPPYFGTEDYYDNIGVFGKNEHELLYKTLKDIKGKFLLSYNDCEYIRELYKDFNIINSKEIDYTLGRNVHGKSKKVSEIYITNY